MHSHSINVYAGEVPGRAGGQSCQEIGPSEVSRFIMPTSWKAEADP
jgi:hypothetical protein